MIAVVGLVAVFARICRFLVLRPRLREWQKAVHSWQSRQNQHKLDTAQKESNRQAKELSREADKMLRELAGQRAPNEDAAEGTQRDKSEPGGEGEGAGAKSGEPQDEDALDFDPLDVFGVEDVMDVGGGRPLFSNFAFEDWVMLSLRFELHLMAHSFARDTDDSDRPGMHIDHLAFYYSRYFQKVLSLGYYGASTVAQLLEMCRDTIEVRKNKVVASLVPDDLDSLGVFVMLTEESRRDRVLRIDCGDESARLKFAAPVPSAPPLPGAFAVVRPSLPAGAGSVQMGQLQMRPPPLPGGPGRPATGWPGAFQPPDPSMPPRPPPPAFQQPPMAGNFQPPPGAKLGAPPPPRPRPVWRSLRPARGP
ncbi:unnamed protein product [Prorocentrum cordatum]|uniref:Uncharacterized protein n=1 Tax=Prorocentrum cordatum TaxID=2364126 RepID=A0ABN9RYL0_9DINO|nr:unnamed protein product [Polarella glacialis]